MYYMMEVYIKSIDMKVCIREFYNNLMDYMKIVKLCLICTEFSYNLSILRDFIKQLLK